jgi:hypothetical protein
MGLFEMHMQGGQCRARKSSAVTDPLTELLRRQSCHDRKVGVLRNKSRCSEVWIEAHLGRKNLCA